MNFKQGFNKSLVAVGAATMFILSFSACDTNQAVEAKATIKGVVVEKPVHEPFSMEDLMEESMAPGGMPSEAGGPPGEPGGMPGAPGEGADPPGGFGGGVQATPAIYIDNGKYSAEQSKTDAVTAGKITDTYASGIKITSTDGTVGGVYVKGPDSEYSLLDATIELAGDVGSLGGPGAGACVEDYATLIIKNSNITTSGASRAASAAINNGFLKVYNSTLITHGNPFTPDITNTEQKKQLEIDGNSRTHVVMTGGVSYFYYCTIIADGWAALSTEPGWLYLEANNCTIKTTKSGYGTYADKGAHNVLNNCDFDVASMAAILEGESDVTFNNPKAKCGTYFALMHCVSTPNEVSTLNVNGGEIACKSPGVIVKSANVNINFDDVKMATESGILVKSQVSVDPNAAQAANTEGLDVYGIHATFKDMDVAGDIIHGDKESRDMWVYLESTTLNGAIKDAYVTIDAASKWIATGNSNVTIVGSVDVTQIDAPSGVTINAVAGESGTYTLASGGTLILEAS